METFCLASLCFMTGLAGIGLTLQNITIKHREVLPCFILLHAWELIISYFGAAEVLNYKML
ncbi:hypothetical protein LguiB_006337 [Lonicera macranthoides]